MNWLNLALLAAIFAAGIGTGWQANTIIREHQEETVTTPDPQRKTVADTSEGVRCSCGFTVNTGDADIDDSIHTDHVEVCPNRPSRPPKSWIGEVADAVFSFQGAVVFVLILLILTHK